MSSWAPWPCMRIVRHSISVGPVAAAGALGRVPRGLEHRLDVVAVDVDARGSRRSRARSTGSTANSSSFGVE